MIRYAKCFNSLVDDNEVTNGFLGLSWFPSAASTAARDQYEATIVKQLDTLGAKRTGWAVLRAIFDTGKSRGKEVRIAPFTSADETTWGEENAFAKAASG